MFIKIIFVWVFLYNFLFACGGGYWPEDYEFNFLHQRNYAFSNVQNNLNFSATYNDIIREVSEKTKKVNLQEWKKEFGNKYSIKQIEEFLYDGKNLSLIKNNEILSYIKFLDKQAPFVSSWRSYYLKVGYNGKKLDKSDVNGLIGEAMSNLATTKSQYLKLRYFFLALRLAHYYNKDSAYSIYIGNKKLLKGSNSIVKDWIQGLYAGILVKRGERVKGVYEFTKLFDKSKLNWYLAFYNFKEIKSDKDWDTLVSMAKNKDEKIKFFTLRALDANANIIEELKNISNININSKYYDLLLFREVLKSQKFFNIYSEDLYYQSVPESKNKYIHLINYLKTVSKDNMYTVNLSLAYFYFYLGDIISSKSYLQKAYKVVKGDDVHELNALDYIIYLNSLKTINKDIENNIANRLDKLMLQECNKNSIFKYTFYKVKGLYKNKGDKFKYFITSSYRYLDVSSINLDRYKKIQALNNKKDKSGLENYMLKKIIFKEKNFDELLESAHFNILMNNLEFEKVLSQFPDKLNAKLEFNIFNNLISGNNRRYASNKSTLKEVLQKIIKIKNNLKQNPNSVMDNYLYGTVLYNLSYWGNLNYLTAIYKSTSSFRDIELEIKKIKLSSKYLKKAFENTKDKEFKAKITYMLAKNELAMYYINDANKSEYPKNGTYAYSFPYYYNDSRFLTYMIKGYGNYFNKLKEDFADTNYYKELLNECGNLENYQYTLKEVYNKEDFFFSLNSFEKQLNELYKQKNARLSKQYNKVFFWKLLVKKPITNETVTTYNNIAYYLQKLYKDDLAIIILEKIIEKYPNRTVAYYNLGDAYWNQWKNEKAKNAYKKYIELMKKAGKENKIPKKVKERVKDK